jgi:hypothetical protein
MTFFTGGELGERSHSDLVLLYRLLPFAIMLAKLPFWAQIKNLRTHCREPHKSTSSGRRNIIVSDLKRYDKGLPEYVKNQRNNDDF